MFVVNRVGAGVTIRSPNKFTNLLRLSGSGVEVRVSSVGFVVERVSRAILALAFRIISKTLLRGWVSPTGFSPSNTRRKVRSGTKFVNPSDRRLVIKVK